MGKILESTRQGVKRVADIVQNLRGFARLDRAEVDQADINEAISAALEMLRGRLDRYGITIEEHKSELPLVAGSPAQLNQVFLNLLVNAMQAIEVLNRADGRITITTEERGGEILVEVTDNGCGIPEENLPRIFTPFFTTKEVGDGTGLGLSITHGIVQDHGGRLQVESIAGQGTCFRVILPITRSLNGERRDDSRWNDFAAPDIVDRCLSAVGSTKRRCTISGQDAAQRGKPLRPPTIAKTDQETEMSRLTVWSPIRRVNANWQACARSIVAILALSIPVEDSRAQQVEPKAPAATVGGSIPGKFRS